jgi:hypothetical protein
MVTTAYVLNILAGLGARGEGRPRKGAVSSITNNVLADVQMIASTLLLKWFRDRF